MRAVLVLDSLFATRERELISRLEIGLADEGVRVAHAVPWTDLIGQQAGLYSVSVGYVPTGLPFTLPQRARMLRETLQQVWDLPPLPAPASGPNSDDSANGRLSGDGPSGVDLDQSPVQIVHAMGWNTPGALWANIGDRASFGHAPSASPRRIGHGLNHAAPIAWSVARQLACELRAGLVLEVCEGRQIGRALTWFERSWTTPRSATAEWDWPPVALVSADEAIDKVLRAHARAIPGLVTSAPWGVHTSADRRAQRASWLSAPAVHAPSEDAGAAASGSLGAAAAVSVLLLASDDEREQLAASVEGLAKARADLVARAAAHARAPSAPSVEPLIFAGGDERALDFVWRLARKLKLLDALTLVPDLEALRDPALSTDLLIVPGGSGRVRTLVLEAMGLGIPVLTGGDAAVSFLSDSAITHKVGAHGSAAAWSEAIITLIADRSRTHKTAEAARRWVREHRPASAHPAAVLAAYSSLLRVARRPPIASAADGPRVEGEHAGAARP